MDHGNFFKGLFKSVPDYRKLVLILVSVKNDSDSLKECRFLKNDIRR